MKKPVSSLWERPPLELAGALFLEAGDALLTVDPDDLRIRDVNPVALKLAGLPREDLVGLAVTELIKKEGPNTNWMSVIQKTGTFHSWEGFWLRTTQPDRQIPVSLTVSSLHFSASPPLALFTIRDLRELHEVMRQSNRTATELKRVLTSIQDCVWNAVVNADGRWQYVYLSPVIERMTGHPVARFIEQPAAFVDVVHSEDRVAYERLIAEIRAGRSAQAEYRLCRADGSICWASERVNCATTVSGEAQLFGIITDVTARKETEEKLRQRHVELTVLNRIGVICSTARTEEAVLRGAIEVVAAALFPDNCGFLLLDATRGVLVTHPSFVLSDPTVSRADKPLGTGITGQVALTGQARRVGDVSKEPGYLAADARTRSELCIPMKIAAKVVGVLNVESQNPDAFSAADEQLTSTIVDLVSNALQRLRTEEALRDSEQHLRQLFECSPDAIFVEDYQGNVLDLNPAAERLHGSSRELLLGRNVQELVPPEKRADVARDFEKLISGELDCIEGFSQTQAGRAVPVELRAKRIVYRDQSAVLLHVRDVTERKQAEEARRQLEAKVQKARKLETLGVLAGGIAHDFNNLLTCVLGYASLAQTKLPPDSPTQFMLGEIEKAAKRAADLTDLVLAYSGKGMFATEPIDLEAVVRETSEMLRPVVGQAELRLELEPAPIDGDPKRIRQVVMNLITNAADALTGTGSIVLRTGTHQADAAFLRSPFCHDDLPEGVYAFFEITDSGCGMSSETLAKIFDPFFTTKFIGRGLGLAAVFGIVRGHRGTIQAASQPGAGTTFLVLLPARTTAVTMTAPAAPERHDHGTILVVDDEDGIRLLAEQALQSFGFSVLLARDGQEALQIYQSQADQIAAVLLDLSMPGLDGLATFQELRRLRSDVRVVFCSGFGDPLTNELLKTQKPAGFVAKPFQLDELQQTLHQALAAETTADAGGADKGRRLTSPEWGNLG